MDVVETAGHGKMLLNDGLVMLTERDEFVYHDMIVHVPLFVHPNPRRVLIIGGGDGGTFREVLRHAGVERAVMVEIDKMVVDACIEHIPKQQANWTMNVWNSSLMTVWHLCTIPKSGLTLFWSTRQIRLALRSHFLVPSSIRISIVC